MKNKQDPQQRSTEERTQDFHTASLGDRTVDIIKLRKLMNGIKSEQFDTKDPELIWQVEPNHHYWEGEDGETLGPDDLIKIKNWENAEKNYPNWKKHILSVKEGDFDFPIWICDMPDMYDPVKRLHVIFDGMHRYTKALIENRKSIDVKVIRLEEIPDEFFVE